MVVGDGNVWDDYDRACEVEGLAGVIAVGEEGAQGLVLADEPASSCYLPEHQAFVRRPGAVRRHIPELGKESWRVCLMTLVTAGALWTYAHPSDSALAAGQADPALADLSLEFAAELETTLARLITGTLARHPDPSWDARAE